MLFTWLKVRLPAMDINLEQKTKRSDIMKKRLGFLWVYLCFGAFLFAGTQTSGKVFYNYSRNLDDGSNSFNIKRGYLTFVNDASETVSYKLTYDIGSNDAGSAYTAFLKVAMVKWETRLGVVSIGMQGMNMYKTMENTWGHRFIAKGSMGAYGYSPSADIGIRLNRKIGPIATSAMVTNGGGYKRPETDAHKKLSLHMVYGQPQLNKEDGFNCGGSFSMEPYDVDDSRTENINVVGIFGGYAGLGFRGGVEFDTKKNGETMGEIISLYGTYAISDKISFLARVDQVDENTSVDKDVIQAIIFVLDYDLGEGTIVAPTFRMTTPENGDPDNSIVVNFEFKF